MTKRYLLAFLVTALPSIGVAFTLKTLIMPGKVVQAHAAIEETCESCHEDDTSETQQELCLGCHVEVRGDVLAGVGFHGRNSDAKGDCYGCHDEHEGRDADIVGLNANAFPHVHTDFALQGAHERATCVGCHAAGTEFRDAPHDCAGCHAGADVHAGALSRTCESCHSAVAWNLTSFDHSVAFPLTGKHAATACAGCHTNQSYAVTPKECGSCHRSDDVHAGRNGAECGSCHNAVAWPVAEFDHSGLTGFALRGSHQSLSCESCHVQNLAAALPSTCEGCHGGDDPHEGGLGPKCGDCHGVAQWVDTKFDHTAVTGFSLAGAHAEITCTSCHTAGLAAKLERACSSCHAADDPHQTQVGARCDTCHSQLAWNAPLRFDHGLIAFPLFGKHAALGCAACHASLAFHDAGSTCVECHAEQDPHRGAFGSGCASCHTPADWRASPFDHAAATGFALTGAHKELSCATCHSDNRQPLAAAGTPSCGSCHRQDDPHGGRFGADCAECHNPDSFSDIRRR